MIKAKTTEIIVSGSAGELDWILPVAKQLSVSGNQINISFLKESARQSFEKNSSLKLITYKNFSVNEEILLSDTDLRKWEFLNRVYRGLYKLSFEIFREYLDLLFAFLNFLLFSRVHKLLKNKPSSVMAEFPSDARLLGAILRGNKNKIVYFPHSPHIYSQDDSGNILDDYIKDHNKFARDSETYLFGSKEDIYALIKDGWQPVKESKILITGHPKYSKAWIEYFRSMTSKGRTGKAFKVGVLSRGIGNFLSQEEHERLVKATHKAITQTSKDFEVQVKLHPREVIGVNTSWDKFLTKGFYLTEDHVYKIFSEVDLVIIMFSSAALDAAVFNIPAIEMYDPDISPALQIKRGENYHTVYELLGLVEKATGEDQIKSKITKVIAGEKFNLKRSESFELLMNRSNNWLDAVNTELFKW